MMIKALNIEESSYYHIASKELARNCGQRDEFTPWSISITSNLSVKFPFAKPQRDRDEGRVVYIDFYGYTVTD